MKPLSLAEAAHFLKMSRSTLYQRKDIPRYRRPGSRALLFDQNELEAWIRTGRVEPAFALQPSMASKSDNAHSSSISISMPKFYAIDDLDIQNPDVYHRNPRYR